MNNAEYMEMVISKNWNKLNFENWEFNQEEMSGSFFLTYKNFELSLYATPYWEDDDGISILIEDDNGTGGIAHEVVPFTITYDNEKDFVAYLKIITEKIKMLDFIIAACLH